jgi:hypothetical protein
VDCYFHNAVPSVAVCRACLKTICATCRDAEGHCPSCRLEERLKAASAARPGLSGQVGPSNPPPNPGPRPGAAQSTPSAPPPRATVSTSLATVSPETRGLVALGYPLWPLAALALIGRPVPEIRRQAIQAVAFNFGFFGLYFGLGALAHIPLLGLSAWPLLFALFPVWLVTSIVYGYKLWNGDNVRVPLISDWLDEREERAQSAA